MEISDKQKLATHVALAVDMVCGLPAYTVDGKLPTVVQIACLESYFINLRALVDFFWRDRKAKDIHAVDYVPDWDEDNERMRELWVFASQNVAHLSLSRLPDSDADIQNAEPRVLAAHAGTILATLETFSAAVEKSSEKQSAPIFRTALVKGRASLQSVV